jgi:phosphogluconate dehydratase
MAACDANEKSSLSAGQGPNNGIVTAYTHMLSAHEPYRDVPELLKREMSLHGATGQRRTGGADSAD